MKKRRTSQEKVKLWRLQVLGDVDLMHAKYVTQSFPRHTHDGFGVGVIERGALGFYYRGENVVASAGVINLVNPGEVHTGHAASKEGWTYRMFYFSADLLRAIASQIAGRPRTIPFFRTGVIHDRFLAGVIHSLHQSLEKGGATILEQESRFLLMLTHLIRRHVEAPQPLQTIGREHQAVKKAIEFIKAHYNQNISIHILASNANLSPFHFIRIFNYHTGLTPHAYLIQVRIKKAKNLLQKGWKIIDTAYETGFTDQSHLSRHFKRLMGFTPGQYSNSVQDT